MTLWRARCLLERRRDNRVTLAPAGRVPIRRRGDGRRRGVGKLFAFDDAGLVEQEPGVFGKQADAGRSTKSPYSYGSLLDAAATRRQAEERRWTILFPVHSLPGGGNSLFVTAKIPRRARR